MRPIGVIYENEAWLAPLFASLADLGVAYERVYAPDAVFDPGAAPPEWSLALNKVSPSSYLRDHAPAIAFAQAYLPYLEAHGVRVVNGSAAFGLETSKSAQLVLLERLGVRAPRSYIITHPSQIEAAARRLRFPVIVKPNVGGSGALMRRIDDAEAFAVTTAIDLGPDGSGVVQEYLEPIDGKITRVEFLDGELLYAIQITNDRDQDFNLCPADICQVPAGADFDNCVVEAPMKKALRIEAFDPPGEMVDAVLRIARAGSLDVGGVEYLVAARDGRSYVYDINALSNFVTDAQTLVGFDPHARFARWLLEHAERATTPIFAEVAS